MADLRQASRPLALGLALLVIALLDAFSLALTLRSQRRLHERATSNLRESVLRLRPRLEALLAPGDEGAWRAAAEEAFRSSAAASVAILDLTGSVLAVYPANGTGLPSADDVLQARDLRHGEVLTLEAPGGDPPSLRSLLMLPSGPRALVVCVSSPALDLARDARDRRQILVAHVVTGAVLLLLLALASLPSGQGTPALPPRALNALEEAMHQLQARDERLSRLHRAEVDAFQSQLRDLSALARAAELTAGIAHEVRNGLGTILGYARLLERAAASPDATDAARGIVAECDMLETTIRRFMEFAKHETLNLGRVDLGRLLSRVAGREARLAGSLQVALDTSGAGEIVADEELLERAFENLVRNAREAAGPSGHVGIAVRREGESTLVLVSDDGPGLPVGLSMRPFATTKPGGLGLGLPLAMKIIQLHQGELKLSRGVHKGAVAEVRLAVQGPVETAQTATNSNASEVGHESLPSASKNVT